MFGAILAGEKNFNLRNNIEVEKYLDEKSKIEEKFFALTDEKISLEGDWEFTTSGRSIYRIHVYHLR